MLKYPNKLDIIFDKLDKHNIKPVIVGGFIRDAILNIKSKDIDIELYSISSYEKLQTLLDEFGKINTVGKSFGICKLTMGELEIDFSFPRQDNKISKGHKGFNIKTKPNIDFKTATSRRDFTINSIGYDVLKKSFLDPYGGIDDIKNKVLKPVNKKTFIEDPLRLLRGMQFCARFELKASKELIDICRYMIENHMLDELSKERIYGEFKKLFLKGKKISMGINFLKQTHSFKYFTQLNMQEKKYNHTLKVLDRFSSNKTETMIIPLSLLCYEMNDTDTKTFLDKITTEKNLFDKITRLKKVARYLQYKEAPPTYSLIQKTDMKELETFLKLLNIDINIKTLKPIVNPKDIIAIGIKPSKKFSEILNNIYEAQLLGLFKTHKEGVLWLKEYFLKL